MVLQRFNVANTGQNPHIGRNLHLHPCNYVLGRFDEDIQPWEGSSITSVCSEFENLDGQGHGVKLETVNMVVSPLLGDDLDQNIC